MGQSVALECVRCERRYEPGLLFDGCPTCRDEGVSANLAPRYDTDAVIPVLRDELARPARTMWDFSSSLPVDRRDAVSMGEGCTPLVRSEGVCAWIGIENLWIKDESRNPTWSHKDRLNAVAVSHARKVGARVITVSSSGNHGASAAAYAGAAGLRSVIFTVGHAPEAMMTMMRVYGAVVLATRTFSERWVIMREGIRRFGWYPTGNFVSPPVGGNPYGIEGFKTIAYETWQQLGGRSPDWIVAPSIVTDLLFGIHRGFDEIRGMGLSAHVPRVSAVERFGPLVNAVRKGLRVPEPVPSGPTVAISIGGGQTTYHAIRVLRESRGDAVAVDEDEILEAQLTLGRVGWFAEASSAAAFAGLRKQVLDRVVPRDAAVVVVLTSTGLKDPAVVHSRLPVVPLIEPTVEDLRAAVESAYGINLQELSA